MDRRHPGALAGAGECRQLVRSGALAGRGRLLATVRQGAADAAAELGRGALGEGEGEDPLDTDAVVDDRGAVALDEHPRLAAAGTGLAEDVAIARLDRATLLRRQ